MDNEEKKLWNKYHKGKKSPLKINDIVTMMPFGDIRNFGRLMRVTKVKRSLSQTGYIVDVKVDMEEGRQIYDIDGSPCFSLSGYDCA